MESVGWTWQAALVGVAGVGLTFGRWWVYFVLPSAEVLHLRRGKCWVWGYGHYVVFGSIAAMGAGLHVAAYYIEHTAHISALATVLTVVVPVAVYVLSIFALCTYLVGRLDPFHLGLAAGAAFFLVLPVVLAGAHVAMPICLQVLTLAPAEVVVGYELVNSRHHRTVMEHTCARRADTTEPARAVSVPLPVPLEWSSDLTKSVDSKVVPARSLAV